MDVEKRGMLIAVIVAVFLSFSSFFISFSMLETSSVTGRATDNMSGSVSISIPSVLSISLANSTVDFGACAINRTKNYSVLDSALGPDDLDNDDCEGGTFPSFLALKNTGTLNANITVSANYTSQEFFNDTGSWYAFRIRNDYEHSGCLNATMQDSYRNFTSTDSYLACDNLSSDSNNTFLLFVKAFIRENATSKNAASITFEAHDVE